MAVTRALNVVKITADNDTIAGPLEIESVVYFPGTGSPDTQIKLTDTNGMILWNAHLSTSRLQENVEIKVLAGDTLHIDMAGTGTVLYLYLCDE